MRLVMTLLVRDEEDVIGENIEFHIKQGVDHFIITDNLSEDGTKKIIADYVRRGLVTYVFEPKDDYSQDEWVTSMARRAAVDRQADWVINSDADEFWMPADETNTLKSALAALPQAKLAIQVPRFNCPPTDIDGLGFFPERMAYRERQSFNLLGEPLPPKVCHRAFADIVLDQGNHSVSHRGIVIPATLGALRILHYPVRSYAQFVNKIVKGGAAYRRNTRLPVSLGHVWRKLFQQWEDTGSLLDFYQGVVLSESGMSDKIRRGDLIYDDRVLQALLGSTRPHRGE